MFGFPCTTDATVVLPVAIAGGHHDWSAEMAFDLSQRLYQPWFQAGNIDPGMLYVEAVAGKSRKTCRRGDLDHGTVVFIAIIVETVARGELIERSDLSHTRQDRPVAGSDRDARALEGPETLASAVAAIAMLVESTISPPIAYCSLRSL